MATKYNYNNPIMSQHLQNAKNKKHINVSSNNGKIVQHNIATGGGHRTGVKTTTVYVYDNGVNNTSSTTQKSMTTAEKFAMGASIATGILGGAAEIISAIKEVNASKAANGTSDNNKTTNKPASTGSDNTSYSTTTGGTSTTSSDVSLQTLTSDTPVTSASAKKANETTGKIDNAISAYKNEDDGNSNVKDRNALVSAVKTAKSQKEANEKTIKNNQEDYDKAVKNRDEFKTKMDEEQKDFQSKIDAKNKELDTAKNETLPKAKKGYEDSVELTKTKQGEYDTAKGNYEQALAVEKDSSLTQEEKDAKLKELGGTSKDLKTKMDQAKKDLDNAKNDEAKQFKAYKDAQSKVDSLGDDVKKITNNKQDALNRATKKLEGFETKVSDAAKKPGVKDTAGNIADNSLAEANVKLQESIDKGNEALGAYAVK